jgi:hypothetical protein
VSNIRSGAVLQLIVDALLATPGIQAVVANRVVGGWSKSSDLATIGKPALVVVADGGSTLYVGSIGQVAVEVYAVSELSTGQALDLYDSARDILAGNELCHAVNRHRGLCVETSRPRTGYISEANVWYAQGRFVVTVATTD